MSTKFSMTRDINGYNGFGILPSTDIQRSTLAANTAQSFTVPTNYPNWMAIFATTPGVDIWVDFTGAAATLPGSSFASSTCVLNPSGRQVKAGGSISIITAAATNPSVCVEFQIIAPYQN
jgi:hypothetical protein